MVEKPKTKRTFTKRITVMVLVWAMAISIYTMIVNPELFVGAMAGILPFMISVIGAYQGTGHADYRAMLNAQGRRNEVNGDPTITPPGGFSE